MRKTIKEKYIQSRPLKVWPWCNPFLTYLSLDHASKGLFSVTGSYTGCPATLELEWSWTCSRVFPLPPSLIKRTPGQCTFCSLTRGLANGSVGCSMQWVYVISVTSSIRPGNIWPRTVERNSGVNGRSFSLAPHSTLEVNNRDSTVMAPTWLDSNGRRAQTRRMHFHYAHIPLDPARSLSSCLLHAAGTRQLCKLASANLYPQAQSALFGFWLAACMQMLV